MLAFSPKHKPEKPKLLNPDPKAPRPTIQTLLGQVAAIARQFEERVEVHSHARLDRKLQEAKQVSCRDALDCMPPKYVKWEGTAKADVDSLPCLPENCPSFGPNY